MPLTMSPIDESSRSPTSCHYNQFLRVFSSVYLVQLLHPTKFGRVHVWGRQVRPYANDAPWCVNAKAHLLLDQPVPKEIPLRPVFKATTSRRTREGPCMGAAGATMC